MAPQVMRRMPRSFLFQTSLILTLAAGSPLPSSTDDEQYQSARRSLAGGGSLQAWEIAVLLLGVLFGIMVLGAVGGICEVALAGRIKKSNDEADAKLEENGSRGIGDRYSWQAEGATADMGDDTTLAGSQLDLARDAHDIDGRGDWAGGSEAAQQTADGTDEEHMQWINEGLSLPSPSRFVTDDVDSPGDGIAHDNGLSYEAYPGHLTPRPPTPGEAGYQHQDVGDEYYTEEDDVTLGDADYQHQDVGDQYYTEEDDGTLGGSDPETSDEMMAPPQAYLGDGYSPAFMPESDDYLPRYRLSQLDVQHEDGSYTAARVSYASARIVSYVSPARTPQ